VGGALALAALFAVLLSWRASPWLFALNLGCLAVALSLPAVPRARLAVAGLADFAAAGVSWAFAVAGGPVRAVRHDLDVRELVEPLRSGRGTAFVRGVVVAAPVLVVFAALFAAADAVFAQLLQDALPQTSGLGPHVVRIALWAWLGAGALWIVAGRSLTVAPQVDDGRERLGFVETALVLGLLDLLFAAFVLVQFRAFFGGADWVRRNADLTYAQYARQGFFQLLAVTVLAVAVLLVLDWLHGGQTVATAALSAMFVLLVGAVMASALQRMRLYQREYGLTELRLYATACMLWLGVVLTWLCVTVLRGRRGAFATGFVASALLTVVVLNALNPDALIARVDIDRAESGKPVDVGYLLGLSEDAAPTIAARLSERPRVDCDSGWRGWSVSRAQARRLLCDR
jgi:hypothetical protein